MRDDPIVAEVRAIREQLAARFGFDVRSVFADLRERQAKLGARLVRRPRPPAPGQAHAPCPDTAQRRGGR